MRPTVSQPIRSRPAIGVLAICCASHATTSSRSRVCWEPGRAHGTGLQVHAAVSAAQPAQLALDHAAVGAEIQMPPALDAPIMDLQPTAGLAADRAHTPPAPETDAHNHPLGAERNVDDGRSGQAKHPRECGLDAHAVLLCGPWIFSTRQPAPAGGGASLAICPTSAETLSRKAPAHAALATRTSPPSREETRITASVAA